MKTPTLSHEDTLKVLAELGRKLADAANPHCYAHEDRHRAERFKEPLQRTRAAWAQIHNGADAATTLSALIAHLPYHEQSGFERLRDAVIGRGEGANHKFIQMALTWANNRVKEVTI